LALRIIMKLLNIIFPASMLIALVIIMIPGVMTSQNTEIFTNVIKIGLLIPDNSSVEAKYGAELAVQKANEKGGINGQMFQLVTRSMEGPWGTGSKEAVNLIFNEKVWAIMGSHDGRNAHLVEQVTTKTRVVFYLHGQVMQRFLRLLHHGTLVVFQTIISRPTPYQKKYIKKGK